ncbi:MAG TPA: ribonuclease Y [Polyangia bacterium]|jgi:ribonuclease Y|nr:ribonuclease Y [Polyangia bacterium]
MIPGGVVIAAVVVTFVIALFVGRALRPPSLPQSDAEKQRLLDAAKAEAESLKRQAVLDAKELAQKARADVEAELKARQSELERRGAELGERERDLDKRERASAQQLEEVSRATKQLAGREAAAEAAARAAAQQGVEARARLERIAGLSQAEAKAELVAEVRDEARRSVADEVKKIEDAARAEADEKSKMIISAAIQRYAGEYVAERTVATVPLPSDDMKGRIIGREGRNIRALEAATGIDLIIDDTPEAVVISCFNPVRREIARIALTRLIADGRIHPTRIEEMVEKATQEVEQQCKEAGEQAAFDLGLGRLHPELVRLLGKLKLRTSGAQNLLQHSIEVGFLAGAMAAELNLPVKTARRAGLLHDIGKALDQEVEGSHAVIGAGVARKLGEPPRVCHAIEAHHGDVPATDVMDHIVDAANVLSGQRPGARREMLESYVQRLADLERIATSFAGVERAFAIQAGREVRVIVENSRVTDQQARLLSKDIARRVEAELTYPGQVKVAVIRETRATDYAK